MTVETFFQNYGSDLVALVLAFCSAIFAFLAKRRINQLKDTTSTTLQVVENISKGDVGNDALQSEQQGARSQEVRAYGTASQGCELAGKDDERRYSTLSTLTNSKNYHWELQKVVAVNDDMSVTLKLSVMDLASGVILGFNDAQELLSEFLNRYAASVEGCTTYPLETLLECVTSIKEDL